jgi:hypothetical protein
MGKRRRNTDDPIEHFLAARVLGATGRRYGARVRHRNAECQSIAKFGREDSGNPLHKI